MALEGRQWVGWRWSLAVESAAERSMAAGPDDRARYCILKVPAPVASGSEWQSKRFVVWHYLGA